MRWTHTRSVLVGVLLAAMLAAIALLNARCRSVTVPAEQRLAGFDVGPYRKALAGSVHGGLVDYAALERDHVADLNRYLEAIDRFGPETTPAEFPSDAARLAYYLNTYNAIMLRRWLDAGAGDGATDRTVNRLWFVFDKWRVDGSWITLHELEQNIIRPRFDEPRIHFALVCGAMDCPPLLDEPFMAGVLDRQLESLGERWFREEDSAALAENGAVRMSAIFTWYRDDFDAMGGLLGVLERYLPEHHPDREAMIEAASKGRIEFMAYDWTINAVRDSTASGG